MKSFDFDFGDYYSIHYDNGALRITELDSDGEYLGKIEIRAGDLMSLHAAVTEQAVLHNPTCTAVSAARTQLEYARDKRTVAAYNNGFEVALKAYMDLSVRHREAFKCEVFH